VIFLEELNQQANSLIRENEVTVPELYLYLAMRLSHYLIDEFQDTSVLQWLNINPMVEEALSTGGSLFYVGDKKQAIFGFRGGEVELFDKVKEKFKDYALPDFLKKNYRSAKEIIEFNNLIFSQENLKRFLEEQQKAINNELKYFNPNDLQEITGEFQGPRQECALELKGSVKLETVFAQSKEERDNLIRNKVLALVKEITKERLRNKDIAILCRGNDEVELLSSWLIGSNIPVESEKTLNIKNNKFIKELVAFLRFLNSPIDNLAFAAFILGELFLTASGMHKQKMHDFLFGLREKLSKEKGFYIFREFRKAFSDIWRELFEESYNEVGFIGLYELLVDILNRFKVFDNFPDQQGFFMHFLQIVRESEEEHPGIFDFLEYFEAIDEKKLFVNSSGADALKVMTIHKAKGLGFEVVIIPFLYLDINDLASQTAKGRVSYVVEQEEDGLRLLRLDKKYAQLSPQIKEKYRQEYKKEFRDELNAIYVALTRAKKELYVFVPHGMRSVNNVARFLFPKPQMESGRPPALKVVEDKAATSKQIESAKYWKWNEFLKEEFSDKRLLEKRAAILEGKILHQILASVANLEKEDEEEAIRLGIESAKDLFPQVTDFIAYEAKVRKVLAAAVFKQFFYLGNAEVFQEKEVVNSLGETKRLDRLIIRDKEVWIVDYKTREEEELDYAKQVNEYKSIIRELYPSHEVKGYLLYLEELKVEEVN
jgi:ATP-dependent exoDNAse (exonuclease V) beta subunit